MMSASTFSVAIPLQALQVAAMKLKRWTLGLCMLLVCAASAHAQQADIDGITAANKAFYAALSSRDIDAMDMVWAHKPYAIYIGPTRKTMSLGYDEVRKSWQAGFKRFSKITVSTADVRVQTDGKLGWTVGTESAELWNININGGKPITFKTFVTHVFEKEGDGWFLVLHHSQKIPE